MSSDFMLTLHKVDAAGEVGNLFWKPAYAALTMKLDAEGGEFIGGEFYYRKKRSKRQQTEEDRLYG
eukprot:scaffold48768_cov18-Tisochrysis_lutea.AAC.2